MRLRLWADCQFMLCMRRNIKTPIYRYSSPWCDIKWCDEMRCDKIRPKNMWCDSMAKEKKKKKKQRIIFWKMFKSFREGSSCFHGAIIVPSKICNIINNINSVCYGFQFMLASLTLSFNRRACMFKVPFLLDRAYFKGRDKRYIQDEPY